MSAEQYKKISELYDPNEKSISNIIEKNNKIFNETLNNISQEIGANSDSIKQLKDNAKDLEESLTVNQDLVEEKLNTLKNQFRVVQNEMIENKAKLKEQLRVQEDRPMRNNIRVNSTEEDENETWEDTNDKLISFLYNGLEVTDELYIEKAHRVQIREGVNANNINTSRKVVAK